MLRFVMMFGAALAASTPPAFSQSMSPMRGVVRSYTDSFAVRVYPQNPYSHRIDVAVRVYDAEFRPVKARVTPQIFTLGAKQSRPVVVVVNFEGERERRVRICTESIPFPEAHLGMKAQICGKFIAHRL
ncbi:hypothetical protein JYP52_20805 [Nitratireductor aquibiodomus]|uniref:hypothetical protein n=1 Tax=Nitratireductor TaxID=245876 RepID=UPI000DE1260B|nr:MULTISPECIES: hypothetical protein [Nitratireductor]MBN7763584.1 hypothetical protein [Nitratireductor aquibiodomus]MDJ1465616.1 hypothetical protein [Nitratireductor sp. GZWM139]